MTLSEEFVIVIGGPAGTGKSTIGKLLSEHLECPFVEGDSYHPESNIKKMSHGIPLTDEDRYPWLTKLTEEAVMESNQSSKHMCIVSCSMLKKDYRKYIKEIGSHGSNIPENCDVKFLFLFLYTNYEDLLNRVSNRSNHFMKSDMVKSQYEIMEIPSEEDLLSQGGDEYGIYTGNRSIEDVLHEVIEVVDEELHQ